MIKRFYFVDHKKYYTSNKIWRNAEKPIYPYSVFEDSLEKPYKVCALYIIILVLLCQKNYIKSII